MSIQGESGGYISFDCSELIEELEFDISEFGGDTLLYVIYEILEGVKIYKDYFFDDPSGQIHIDAAERIQVMTASALMEVYKMQNSII